MKNSNSLLHDQLQKYYKAEKKNTQDLLYQISALIFKTKSPDTDLYELYKNDKIDVKFLDALINYKDGGYIKLPTKKEWKKCLFLAISFYLKYIKGYDWIKISKMLNISERDLSVAKKISTGLELKTFSKKICEEFSDLILQIKDKQVLKSFYKILDEINKE